MTIHSLSAVTLVKLQVYNYVLILRLVTAKVTI